MITFQSVAFRRRPRVHRAVAAIALAGYTILAVGLPIPTVANWQPAANGKSPAFPCQGGRCGCRTAEQCWSSCCCHTATERLAWARAHGVAPPASLLALIEGEPKPQASAVRKSCCASGKSCCETAPVPANVDSSTAVEPSSGAQSSAHSAESSDHGEPVVVWVSYWQSQRCRGDAPLRGSVPISLPPTPKLEASFQFACVSLASAIGISPPSPDSIPPDPPPRLA